MVDDREAAARVAPLDLPPDAEAAEVHELTLVASDRHLSRHEFRVLWSVLQGR
jgi:hypothetical protein